MPVLHLVGFALLTSLIGFGCGSVSGADRDAAVGADATTSADAAAADGGGGVDPGMALRFDGADDLVTVPHDASFDFTVGTIEAWVQLDAATGGAAVAMWGEGGLPDKIIVHFEADELVARTVSALGQTTVTAAVPQNTWMHIAVVHDGNSMVIYLNGAQVATTAVSGAMPVPTTGLRLGITAIINGNQSFLDGEIDEVRVWSVARTAKEIDDNHNRVVPAAAGLVAYYNFNTVGQVVVDSSLEGNNGVLGTTSGEDLTDPEYVTSGALLIE